MVKNMSVSHIISVLNVNANGRCVVNSKEAKELLNGLYIDGDSETIKKLNDALRYAITAINENSNHWYCQNRFAKISNRDWLWEVMDNAESSFCAGMNIKDLFADAIAEAIKEDK